MATKDPEARRAYMKAYWAANRDRLLEQQRERGRRNYAANPARYAERGRKSRLKRLFGLTPAQYDTLLIEQGGVCAICLTPPDPKAKAYPVDHDHETGQIRGILCGTCNRALGLFRDDPQVMARAIAYLTRSSSGSSSTTNKQQSKKSSPPQD